MITLSYSNVAISLQFPNVGYESIINFPFDIVQLDTGLTYIRDEGITYDKRSCEAEFLLTADEQKTLNDFIKDTVRGQAITMTLQSGCGFFPFAPDLGDSGDWPVAVNIVKTGAIGYDPFKYFKCKLAFQLVGSAPTFSLPDQVEDGTFYFANVQNVRTPQNLYSPKQEYGFFQDFTENNSLKVVDRGSGSDFATTRFVLSSNESKATMVLYNIVNTYRAGNIPISTQSDNYIFGMDHGDTGSYQARLDTNTLKITHEKHNEFTIEFTLSRVS